jgi:hypothetical protein
MRGIVSYAGTLKGLRNYLRTLLRIEEALKAKEVSD